MNIFHILLLIYLVLTFIAILISYTACIVASRSETLRVRQQKSLSHLLSRESAKPPTMSIKDKKWVFGIR